VAFGNDQLLVYAYVHLSLLLDGVSHEPLFGALWTQNVLVVRYKTLPDHRDFAGGTIETVVVPVAALERYKSRAANTGDGFGARRAPLGEELAEAVGAVGFVVSAGEPLTRQGLFAVGASEALPVPGVVAVSDAALRNNLFAFDALGGEFILVAFGAVDVVLFGDEALGSDGVFARAADEAFFVPLASFVFHLFHACSENVSASVASGGELGVVAGAAVNTVGLRAELFVHQRHSAFRANEASLVPMFLFVAQIFGVDSDELVAFITIVGEYALVAFDAVGVVVPQNVSVACQGIITMMAKHLLLHKVVYLLRGSVGAVDSVARVITVLVFKAACMIFGCLSASQIRSFYFCF